MAWKQSGQPTIQQQRGKWVARVEGIDTETGECRPRQIGTFTDAVPRCSQLTTPASTSTSGTPPPSTAIRATPSPSASSSPAAPRPDAVCTTAHRVPHRARPRRDPSTFRSLVQNNPHDTIDAFVLAEDGDDFVFTYGADAFPAGTRSTQIRFPKRLFAEFDQFPLGDHIVAIPD